MRAANAVTVSMSQSHMSVWIFKLYIEVDGSGANRQHRTIHSTRTLSDQAGLRGRNHHSRPIHESTPLRTRKVRRRQEVHPRSRGVQRRRRAFNAAFQLAVYPGLPQQPLQSFYCPMQADRVYLVEYGAGFFVERTAKEATEFYNRKINLIKERLGKLQEVIQDKREGLRAIEVRMLTLIQQQQQQQQQQQRK